VSAKAAPDVAVVGADGSLGRFLIGALSAQGARGVALRHASERLDATCDEVATADVVVNVAGPRVRPGLAWTDYLREHVGTAEAITRSMRAGARLVHVSSAAVYGTRPGEVIDARSPEAPATFPNAAYAWAKLAAEHAARACGKERGLDVVVLRLPLVHGPGVDGAITSLVALAERGVTVSLSPEGLRQHLVHTTTLASGMRALVHTAGEGPLPGDGPVLLADPVVHTSATLNALFRRHARGPVRAPVPLAAAARLAARWPGFPAREPPGPLAAFAALAVDLELDWREAFERLGLAADPASAAVETLM
jgi:UDP-glucose 4-epimerase